MHGEGEGEGDNGDDDVREMMSVSPMGGTSDGCEDAAHYAGRNGLVDGGPKLAFSFSGGGEDGIPNPRRRHAESSPCLSQIYNGVLTFGHCCNVSSPSVS